MAKQLITTNAKNYIYYKKLKITVVLKNNNE